MNKPLARFHSHWAIFLGGGILVFAALAAYHNTFSCPFFLDDLESIPENRSIRHLASVLQPPFGTTVSGRPVVNLSLALNYALGGKSVWGYHALNLVIHILAGLTLFGIVRRTLLRPGLREKFGEASLFLACAVALLWTLHPLQTEAVTYLVQRAESLMGLFYLLTLYCFIRGAGIQELVVNASTSAGHSMLEEPAGHERKPKAGAEWFLVSVICCLLGMGTKEVMVSAPVMVLFYDRTFVAGSFEQAWRKRKWFYTGLAATWGLLVYVMASTGGNRGGTIGFGVGVAWWAYALTQFKAIVCYLKLSVWPHPLVFEYGGYWIKHAGEVVPYAVVVILLLGATVVGLRRWPALGFLGAWFFVILAPTSSVVPGTTQMIVEHRMYLSLAAIMVLLVLGVYRLMGKRSTVAFLALAAGCGFLTERRNEDYRDELTLWRDTVAKRPGNAFAYNGVGAALVAMGRFKEAIENYEQALRINPNFVMVNYNIGIALAKENRLPEAIEHYERALQFDSKNPAIQGNLGDVLLQAGKVDEAIAHYKQALEINPDYPNAHNDLGNALLQAGKVDEAIAHYEQALQINPDYAQAYYNLGIALVKTGRARDGLECYKQALALKPDYVEAHYNLGLALVQTGRLAEGIEHFEQALRLKPDYAEAHNSLGNALARMGRMTEAFGHFEQALRLKPDYAEAHTNWGTALLQTGRIPEAIGHFEQALRLKPDYAEAHTNFGNALVQAGRLPEAIDHYEQALRLKPDLVETHYNLGNALLQTGRVPEAIKHYREALRLRPDFEPARQILAQLQASQ